MRRTCDHDRRRCNRERGVRCKRGKDFAAAHDANARRSSYLSSGAIMELTRNLRGTVTVLDLDQSYSADEAQNSQSANEENNMNLHTPSVPVFVISLVLAALALIGHFALIPFITLYGFWLAIIAYLILAAGIVMKT